MKVVKILITSSSLVQPTAMLAKLSFKLYKTTLESTSQTTKFYYPQFSKDTIFIPGIMPHYCHAYLIFSQTLTGFVNYQIHLHPPVAPATVFSIKTIKFFFIYHKNLYKNTYYMFCCQRCQESGPWSCGCP